MCCKAGRIHMTHVAVIVLVEKAQMPHRRVRRLALGAGLHDSLPLLAVPQSVATSINYSGTEKLATRTT